MLQPQSFDGLEHLPYLVGFGHSFPALYVYSWITLPRHLIHSVAGAPLTRLAEIVIAYVAQIAKTNICGVTLHLGKDVFNSAHIAYSIIIDIAVKDKGRIALTEGQTF